MYGKGNCPYHRFKENNQKIGCNRRCTEKDLPRSQVERKQLK
jgi:hypothetical protein